jgi:ethanolamine utilization protein EutA
LQIAQREILYQSPVHFTPLVGATLVDGEKIRTLVEQEYRMAGIHPEQIDTGAVIITGESSRKENAGVVLNALAESSGRFVVATAGPHLESVLAAKGAGADHFSEERDCTVLHMDIGGGTSNLALLKKGQVVATGCLNVGGRLLKFDENGRILYRSPVLQDRTEFAEDSIPAQSQLEALCEEMVCALEIAAGLRPMDERLSRFWTQEAGNPWLPPENIDVISFSGGVAACIDCKTDTFSFGDIGPMLGQAIRKSLLCSKEYRVAGNAIRATVIGAGCHSAQLSGSTVFYRGVTLPMKNLPVVSDISQLAQLDTPGILMLPGEQAMNYQAIASLADQICRQWPHSPVLIALEADMAKALGHALALRLPPEWGILCIDRVKLTDDSFLDVGQPVASALPVVVKTLILSR